MVKYLYWVGLAACLLLIACCFMPWTYYVDIDKTFTGFFSEQNMYGKPGVLLSAIASTAFVFMVLKKIWASRTNLFVTALGMGYAIKTYILYTSCYNALCPDKKPGIYLMLISMAVIFLSAIFPDIKIKRTEKQA